ncbi:MAG: hypothetical protein HYX63_23750 [Gammaproteobacteria bacterium]|nr:hypothetical protein [Gammaproteobacteria bacterium]
MWDEATNNLLAGREELTLANTLPLICNLCQLPIVQTPGESWKPEDHMLVYAGRRYYFQSHVDKWVFQQNPRRYGEHKSLVDRAAAGEVQPPTFEGALNYMGLARPSRARLRRQQLRVAREFSTQAARGLSQRDLRRVNRSLVAKPALDECVARQFGRAARAHQDTLTAILTDAHLKDVERARRWTTAFVHYGLSQAENVAVVAEWVARWQPLADRAIDAWCAGHGGRRARGSVVAVPRAQRVVR